MKVLVQHDGLEHSRAEHDGHERIALRRRRRVLVVVAALLDELGEPVQDLRAHEEQGVVDKLEETGEHEGAAEGLPHGLREARLLLLGGRRGAVVGLGRAVLLVLPGDVQPLGEQRGRLLGVQRVEIVLGERPPVARGHQLVEPSEGEVAQRRRVQLGTVLALASPLGAVLAVHQRRVEARFLLGLVQAASPEAADAVPQARRRLAARPAPRTRRAHLHGHEAGVGHQGAGGRAELVLPQLAVLHPAQRPDDVHQRRHDQESHRRVPGVALEGRVRALLMHEVPLEVRLQSDAGGAR
mmetsp:Transcript_13801/g.40917  ORF Transcript_13801/g.40917 Transcript_13801/m.40917 type:complete len:297 (-) Transcript_13801:564-1454(-)